MDSASPTRNFQVFEPEHPFRDLAKRISVLVGLLFLVLWQSENVPLAGTLGIILFLVGAQAVRFLREAPIRVEIRPEKVNVLRRWGPPLTLHRARVEEVDHDTRGEEIRLYTSKQSWISKRILRPALSISLSEFREEDKEQIAGRLLAYAVTEKILRGRYIVGISRVKTAIASSVGLFLFVVWKRETISHGDVRISL